MGSANCSLRQTCHVAWGYLSRPARVHKNDRLGCLPFQHGFSATQRSDALFMQFGEFSESTPNSCWSKDSADLECRNGTDGTVTLPGFFDRHGHHLFSTLNGGKLDKLVDEAILRSGTVVAELYRRALQLPSV